MKTITKLFVAVAVLLISVTSFAAKPNTLKILAIGNSFSANAVDNNLYQIAQADGVTLIIGNMVIGGCTLERHFNNAQNDKADYSYRKTDESGTKVITPYMTLEKALADEEWDVVSFQQASGYSGHFDTFEPFLSGLIEYVKAHTKADVKLCWHQTWAYAQSSTHKRFPSYGSDQIKMYSMILDASMKACKQHNLTVIPSGAAIQNLRDSFVGDNVCRDGYHLNPLGCYTAACTWYQTLTKRNVVGNSYRPKDIPEAEIAAAQKAACAAVKKPFKAR